MPLQITVDELAKSPDKYLDMTTEQDICVARDGKDIARITGVMTPKMKAAQALKGILPPDIDIEKERLERILK